MAKYIKIQENVYDTFLALKSRKKQQEFLEKCFIFAWEGREIETKDAIVSVAFLGVKPSLKICETSTNWGGSRENSGRKSNQDENQVDNQDEIKSKSSPFISNKYISNKNINIQTTTELGDSDKSKNSKDDLDSKENKLKESFEVFWKQYPKQRAGSKEKAFKSYCKVIKENRCTEDKLLEVCSKYAQSDEVKRGFAKGCAAWLNDDRFNNEYKVLEQKEYW